MPFYRVRNSSWNFPKNLNITYFPLVWKSALSVFLLLYIGITYQCKYFLNTYIEIPAWSAMYTRVQPFISHSSKKCLHFARPETT